MSVRQMTLVWDLDLPDSQKIVLLALADAANDGGHCWPSMSSLVRKCCRSERTIQGVIKKLVEAGHLTRQEVPGKGCNYYLHPRKDCTPAADAPPQPATGDPRSEQQGTPAAAAGKPSRNRKEPSTSCASGDAPALKPEHVVDEWNKIAPRLGKPKVLKLTPERRQLLKARIGQYSLDDFVTVFGKIEASPFLRGDTGWRGCAFDWIFKKANFQKVLEGNYDD